MIIPIYPLSYLSPIIQRKGDSTNANSIEYIQDDGDQLWAASHRTILILTYTLLLECVITLLHINMRNGLPMHIYHEKHVTVIMHFNKVVRKAEPIYEMFDFALTQWTLIELFKKKNLEKA